MSRSSINIFLAIFFAVTIGAVIVRVDYFPLTWVPMYSVYEVKENVKITIGDKERIKRGFEVTRKNGETDFISAKDLNIPRSRLRKIYQQRAFGNGPPKYSRERLNLNPVSTWLYDELIGEDPRNIEWGPRILASLNGTFGLTPEDPDFIVEAVAVRKRGKIGRDLLLSGELTKMDVSEQKAVLTWEGE